MRQVLGVIGVCVLYSSLAHRHRRRMQTQLAGFIRNLTFVCLFIGIIVRPLSLTHSNSLHSSDAEIEMGMVSRLSTIVEDDEDDAALLGADEDDEDDDAMLDFADQLNDALFDLEKRKINGGSGTSGGGNVDATTNSNNGSGSRGRVANPTVDAQKSEVFDDPASNSFQIKVAGNKIIPVPVAAAATAAALAGATTAAAPLPPQQQVEDDKFGPPTGAENPYE